MLHRHSLLLAVLSVAFLMFTPAAAQPHHASKQAIKMPAPDTGIPLMPDQEELRMRAANAACADEPFHCISESMPEFPGDLAAFISENMHYPDSLLEAGIEGRVFVQFIVHADGSPGDAKVVRPAHPLLDAEALRIIGIMPCWKPGRQLGRSVDVVFTLPFTFALD